MEILLEIKRMVDIIMIMKIIRKFGVHLREGFKGLYRNIGLALTSIITMNLTLLVVSAAIVLSINVDNFSTLVKQDFTIYVPLNLDVSVSRGEEIAKEFAGYENVLSSVMSSKNEERLQLMDEYPAMDELMSYYDGEKNPLHNVIYIKFANIEDAQAVIKKIEGHEDVNEVIFLKEMIESLLLVFEIVQYVGFTIVAALLLVTLVVISNTIKITIFSRKKSIEIMRLIGATKGYIVAPHIVEGMLIGILGSIIPILLTVNLYNRFFEETGGRLLLSPFLKFVEPSVFVVELSIALFIVGIGVSVLGSRRSVRKYLRGK